jgi:hypothetical protein
MFFSDEIRRTSSERIARFHHEASVQALRPSYRVRLANAFRRIATWIEPEQTPRPVFGLTR